MKVTKNGNTNRTARRIAKRSWCGILVSLGCLVLAAAAFASGPNGVLVILNPANVANFDARHNTTAVRLNGNRNLYLVTSNTGLSDSALLNAINTDGAASDAELNSVVTLDSDQSTASVLNSDQSTASVLNDSQSTASVLNSDQSTASVLNGWVDYYGSAAPSNYVIQPVVGQIHTGSDAHALSTGKHAIVALIDNGVDQFNPVLRHSLLHNGYNFFDNTANWSAFADLAQSTASVLNADQSTASVLNADQSTASVLNADQSTASVLNSDQSTASVLNSDQSTASVLNDQSTASVLNCAIPGQSGLAADQSTASVLNSQSTASVLNSDQSTASVLNSEQSTASVLNADQSTASVLNDQSTASVLNSDQSTASVLNALSKILACNPDFGHGTEVAGLIHLVAPEAKILPIKAFGPSGQATAAIIYKSLTYAIDQHADVINLSFSSLGTTNHIRQAIKEAVANGIIVAAAAGNDNSSVTKYPAALDGVLGVGAVNGCGPNPSNADPNPPCQFTVANPGNPTFPKADFSNFDSQLDGPDVKVTAPGVELFTTYPGFGRLWATVSGTSFSTPLVAGEAALLVSRRQSGAKNRTEIENSANSSIVGDLGGGQGYGLINVLQALGSVHN